MISTTFCFSRWKAVNLIPVPVLSISLFYFYFFTLQERSKELRTRGEIVSRTIRHNLITQMFYGLNFIIVLGGGGVVTSFSSIRNCPSCNIWPPLKEQLYITVYLEFKAASKTAVDLNTVARTN